MTVEMKIQQIENILTENSIEFETSGEYINILNTSSMTRIHVFEFQCVDVGVLTAVVVQEFDESGNQIYSYEFDRLGKAFLKRITRNLG